MCTIRTFIALAMPEEALRELHRMQDLVARDVASGIRWAGPESMHVTIKFLGATGEALVQAIAQTLDDAVRGMPPVRFSLTGLGAFPNVRNPKVLWAGLTDNGVMAAVHRTLEPALEALGYARESRPYVPHLTLGRVRDFHIRKALAHALELHGGRQCGEFAASRIVLYKSELLPSGASYTALHESSLSGAV